jgi:hypothetical protein
MEGGSIHAVMSGTAGGRGLIDVVKVYGTSLQEIKASAQNIHYSIHILSTPS